MHYEYSLFDHDEQVVRAHDNEPEGCCAPTDGDGGARNECGISPPTAQRTRTAAAIIRGSIPTSQRVGRERAQPLLHLLRRREAWQRRRAAAAAAMLDWARTRATTTSVTSTSCARGTMPGPATTAPAPRRVRQARETYCSRGAQARMLQVYTYTYVPYYSTLTSVAAAARRAARRAAGRHLDLHHPRQRPGAAGIFCCGSILPPSTAAAGGGLPPPRPPRASPPRRR